MSTTTLDELLAEWLPSVRWFGAKDRAITGVRAHKTSQGRAGDGQLLHVVGEVSLEDGSAQHYNLPLVVLPDEDAAHAHALVGECSDPQATGWVYDAMAHPLGQNGLYRLLSSPGRDLGSLHCWGTVDLEPLSGRVIGAEQSNTSVVYGDQWIMKLFRRLVVGLNPDLEVTRALASVGSDVVAPPVAWAEMHEPFHATLAILQPYFRTATEGWALAVTSVRDLYAERDLHADEVGGDFAGEAYRLGAVTARLHQDLAHALPHEVVGSEDCERTAALLQQRLELVAGAIPEVEAMREGIAAVYAQVALIDHPVTVQRIHGDYHLGQVLRVDNGWVVLDFEGEPARSLEERTTLLSPLRDVAGMLRSFDYAAQHLLADHPQRADISYRALEWAQRNRDAFCDGYAEVAGRDPRLDDVMLRALELDKAVYEAAYEFSNRPSWLPIPLSGMQRLIDNADDPGA